MDEWCCAPSAVSLLACATAQLCDQRQPVTPCSSPAHQNVVLEATLLKPQMCIPGADYTGERPTSVRSIDCTPLSCSPRESRRLLRTSRPAAPQSAAAARQDRRLTHECCQLPSEDTSSTPLHAQDVIADETLRVMRRCVPAAVPGIMFLSGGQVRPRHSGCFRLHSTLRLLLGSSTMGSTGLQGCAVAAGKLTICAQSLPPLLHSPPDRLRRRRP